MEIEEFDTADPVVDGLPDDVFGRIAADYLAQGGGTQANVGAADSVLLDAPELHRFAVKWLESWAARRGAAGDG
jgi:aminoglycoside 3-N-acetyltransferase